METNLCGLRTTFKCFVDSSDEQESLTQDTRGHVHAVTECGSYPLHFVLGVSLEDNKLLEELETLKEKSSEEEMSVLPTVSPHKAESLLDTVTEPSGPCSVPASTMPPSCWT